MAVYVEEFDGLPGSCLQRYPGITITLFHLDDESIKLIMEAHIAQLLIFVLLFLFVFWCWKCVLRMIMLLFIAIIWRALQWLINLRFLRDLWESSNIVPIDLIDMLITHI